LNAISNGLALPAPGNGVSGGVKPHKFGGNNWRLNLAATNAGVSDNNQRPVFASKRAFATRRASSGRRPLRSLRACALSVGCIVHYRRSAGIVEKVRAGDPGWPLTEERYLPFRTLCVGLNYVDVSGPAAPSIDVGRELAHQFSGRFNRQEMRRGLYRREGVEDLYGQLINSATGRLVDPLPDASLIATRMNKGALTSAPR